jgi:ubiquitin carboxyl-terminal hydrolase 10
MLVCVSSSRLFAAHKRIVLYHHGIYATGGHYTLDVLHPNQKKEAWGKGWKEGWIHIDDEQITETSIQDVVAQRGGEDRTPYLLFYRQSGYQS